MTRRQWLRSKMKKELSLETVSNRKMKQAVRMSGYFASLHNQVMMVMGFHDEMRARRSNWKREVE